MVFFLKLAQQMIRITTEFGLSGYLLRDFVVENTGKVNLEISTSREEVLEAYQKKIESLTNPIEFFRQPYDIEETEYQLIYKKIAESLPLLSVMVMHGAVVCDGKNAFMFTGPSGIGKTTRAQLFIQHHPNSYIINGDKPLIRFDRTGVYACGSPWNGKEQYGTNEEAPLKAIYFVERARDTDTVLTEIQTGKAFSALIDQIYMPSEAENVKRTIEMIKMLQERVRLYHFQSEASFNAVEEAWAVANS